MADIPEDVRDPLFSGPPLKATWMEHLSKSDWLFDGHPIRGDMMTERFNDLDWSKAWVDMGPSIAGNIGPYWHVPLVGDDETVHRLYPKLLQTKWLPLSA